MASTPASDVSNTERIALGLVGLAPLSKSAPPISVKPLCLTSTNFLVSFDSADPADILTSVKIKGLAPGEDIVSIDSRAANGLLYGLTKQNTLYTLNPYSGVATKVGPAGAPDLALVGKAFAIDFNPSVDRLRVVTDADQNLRINPLTGVVVDGDGVTAGTQPDTALAFDATDVNTGKNPNIAEIAYDRNFVGTTQTTLFGIDSNLNALVRIGGVNGTPSPNAGAVFTVGALTVGGVSVDPAATVGFEIAADGTAYASLLIKGKTKLYTVDLGTGAATEVGLIGKGTTKLDSVADLPRQEIVFAVTQGNRLVSFHADNPGRLESAVALRGLIAGESVASIDFRPATGELFALTSSNRTLTIDVETGKVQQVGVPLVTTPQFTAGSVSGLDFNPTVDRLRLVNADDDNLRYNPLTFAPVDSDANSANGNTPDTDLAYIATDSNVGQDPNIVGIAYDRNDNNAGTPTTLWGIDSVLNILVRQGAIDGAAADTAGGGSPNGGLLNTIGALGLDTTDKVGFDIADQGTQGNGVALAIMQINGETASKLFAINLTAGLTNQPVGGATLIGTVAGGEVITAMAIAPSGVEFGAANYVVKEKAGTFAVIEVKRTGGTGSTSSVRFDTFDRTAIGGADYTEVINQIVTFAPGETLKRILIPILGDTEADPNETVGLTLSSVTGGSTILGGQSTSLLTIK